MKEIYQASKPTGTWFESEVPGFLGAWWFFWLLATLGTTNALSGSTDDSLVAAVFVIIAGVLAIRVVRSIHVRQEKKAAREELDTSL